MPAAARAILIFDAAGLAEIGGGRPIRQWLREGRTRPFRLVGALVIVLHGVIPPLRADPHFGRVYAAYGGVFIGLALLWGRIVDGFQADRRDLPGSAVYPVGVLAIFFGPR